MKIGLQISFLANTVEKDTQIVKFNPSNHVILFHNTSDANRGYTYFPLHFVNFINN